jgi:glycosyltransferase involved in cell wall biosynthesis
MLLGLASGLTEQGHEVVIYGRGREGERGSGHDLLAESMEAGIEVRSLRWPILRSGLPPYVGTNPLFSPLERNEDRLDVMVVHGMFGRFSGQIASASTKAGTPCIACPHDPYSSELFGTHTMAKKAYWRLLEAPFLEEMRAIHVLAPSHMGYLRALGISTPAFVVPNGLSRNQLERCQVRAGPTRTQAAEHSEFHLLYLGRWDVYNKGLDLLLQALAADPESRWKSTVHIAGNGSSRERRRLEHLISALRLGDRVSLVGYIKHTDPAIRSADALILPSRFDGFGQVVIESIAAGTPVIVSSKAGSSEFLGPEHGVVVVNPNVPSIVRGLRTAAAAKDQLREAAYSAGAYLAREFSWDRLASDWIQQVERLGVTDGRRLSD